MLDSLLSLFLQLPLGILFAAGLLECFVLFKDRRDAEPAVLWLLFCASVAGLLCGGVYFLKHGTPEYTIWAGLAAGLAAVGFWFKRQARNRGVASLKDRFMVPGSYSPVKIPGQTFYVLGYRFALVGAVALTLVGLQQGNVLTAVAPSATTEGTNLAANAPAPAPAAPGTPTAPAPVDPATPAPAPAGNGEVATTTPPAPPANPGDPAAPATPATPPTVAEGTPAAPAPDGTTPAPTTPPATGGTPETAGTTPPPATPGTPPAGTPAPAPAPGTPAAPAPGTPGAATPPAAPVPAMAAADVRPISKNSIFGSKIRPIIQRYCVTCHGAEKQKGDLRLDTPDFIRTGVRGKAVVLAGKPDQSGIYMSITKPPGDDDRMPPKGDGVSPADAALIKKWIADGADMGDGVTTANSGATKFAVDDLGAKLQPPPAALLDELKKEGVLVRPISKDGKVIELDFSHSDLTAGNVRLERLAPIAGNINVLDLSRTKISDNDLAVLAGMKHLARLILSRTDTTDAGLVHLKDLPDLEYINIYQTKVTDAGLKNFENLKKLRKLYAWQSMVTPGGATGLEKKIPGLAVNMGVMPAAAPTPVMTPPRGRQ